MQRFAGVFVSGLVLSATIAASGVSAAPTKLMPAKDKAIAGQYIVVLKDGPRINAGSVAQAIDASPLFVYDAALNGFAAKLNAGQLKQLQKHPEVAYIEQDSEVSMSSTWGLDRIDQFLPPLNNTYNYNTTAPNVTAYIIDSGIYTAHNDFNGQAVNVYDAFGGNGQDCHGHGTHVAGIVGGQTYGVAKDVQLRGLRVLDCQGVGTTSGVLGAINWLASSATSPAVANISLTTPLSAALNNATTNLINTGVTVAVPAGNNNQNACNYSPGSVPNALTVATSLINDARAPFSNFGTCVDLYAPGGGITSAWIGSPTASSTVSGTSQSSPHVAGVAALYLAYNPGATPAQVSNWINSNATPGIISGNILPTPNRLLYKSNL